ncbi:hypothetical protein EYZ11_002886 [Aspergillus tanneri]|uniref:Uncharacterized protein n=1 Tax=Aspergillus tanneri TaxID=1220188 RepID=A0A4S3JQD7_9EURO|nr:hypothetical protein EYZ11_002886 [Aspergillus tanneri]
MFDSKEAYERVKNANVFTNQRVMSLYHLQEENIITNITSDIPSTKGLLFNKSPPFQDRSTFSAKDSVEYMWRTLGLPLKTLEHLHLPGNSLGLPSSFKIAHLAQASVGLPALLASQIYAHRNHSTSVPDVAVPLQHATIEVKSDHRDGAKALLGCPANSTREQLGTQIADWHSVDLGTATFDSKLVISALRSYSQWDMLPQARAIANFPILLRKLSDGPAGLPPNMQSTNADKCLPGLRVPELSRVIAAPLSGKTLASSRRRCSHRKTIKGTWTGYWMTPMSSSKDSDPGPSQHRGCRLKPSPNTSSAAASCVPNVCVQTCSGMNVSEAEHFGAGDAAQPTPCQAPDHVRGYFLAAGIMAALYKQATEGGSWRVDVPLAGVMKYLRSLGSGKDVQGSRRGTTRSLTMYHRNTWKPVTPDLIP